MRAVLQRARSASVVVDGEVVGSFEGAGLVILLGVSTQDTGAEADAPPGTGASPRRARSTRNSWVGASGTSAGFRVSNSFRSTGSTSSPKRSICRRTVSVGRPAWSMRNIWRW